MNRFLSTIVSWLRAGYPNGVPHNDYLPLLALLSRRLTSEEVAAVAREVGGRPGFDDFDIGAAILAITDEMPSNNDVERVREYLDDFGWPLDEPRDENGAEA